MSLRKMVKRAIQSVSPETPLRVAAQLMRDHKIGSLFIKEEQGYTGILTEADIVRRAIASDLPLEATACFLMSSPIIDIDIDQSVDDANHQMHFNGIRHLAISEQGKITGLISVRDLVRHFSEAPHSPLSEMDDICEPLTILTHRDLQTVVDTATVKEAAQKMATHRIGALFVTFRGAIQGIITESDLVRKVARYGISGATLPVGVIMSTPIFALPISASLREANQLMATREIRHLAVTEAGKIIGILSIRDLIGLISIRDLPRFFATQV